MAGNSDTVGKRDSLSRLVEDTVTAIQTNVKCERAVKIQNAVAKSIKLFLAELAKEEPLFKPAEVIQVGSYAEGTKILEADEFDFLVIIDELSTPGVVAIDNNLEKIRGGTNLPKSGYVTLTIADDKLKPKWEKYCDNGLLQCFQNSIDRKRFTIDRARFGNIFIKAILKLYKERVLVKRTDAMITCSSTEIDFINCVIGLPAVDDIALNLRRVEFKTPNILINLELDDLKIGVDLSPAIRYHKILDCFKPEDCAGSALSELILRRESLLLVANRNFDFRVTVTEAEVDYIQHIMKHEHKVIYIFLEYINYSCSRKNSTWEPFSSYMLKNICLIHDLNCQLRTRTISSCLKCILEYMSACCSKMEILSAVNSKVVLYDSTARIMNYNYRKQLIVALSHICQRSEGISTVEEVRELSNRTVEEFLARYIVEHQTVYYGSGKYHLSPHVR